MLGNKNMKIKEDFKIEDMGQANWALSKMREIDIEIKEIKDFAINEIKRVKDWEENEFEKSYNQRDYFEGLLTEYYVKNKEIDDNFKINLPYGTVSSRKAQDEWVYNDKKVINWLEKNNKELIRVKKEVNKAEFKKMYKVHGENAISEQGEIIEGVEILKRPDNINIKINE
jgi:hypothetical protein